MLSIVIPTLNEENYLPRLLRSIKEQDFTDYEIIVADARSQDGTSEIAKLFGCKVVDGGLPGKGRNEGVKVAQGDIVLFIDADTYIPPQCLNKSVAEFKKRNLDVAAFLFKPLPEEKLAKFYLNLYNYPLKNLEERWVHGGGAGILIKRLLHKTINGYSEVMKFCEDHDYVQRAARIGRFGAIKSTEIYIDTRRFKKDGWFKTGLRYIAAEINMKLKRPLKSAIFEYKFNHYDKTD